MEQRRRTITAANKVAKKKDRKKLWAVAGVILGFVLIFAVSYGITYGLITSDKGDETSKTAVSSSAEDDIANMSRADLEKGYLKLKKQLEEKNEEIDMLKKRLGQHEETADEEAPSTTTTPDEDEEEETSSEKPSESDSSETTSEQEQTPPPATDFSNGGLMSPGELDSLVGATE